MQLAADEVNRLWHEFDTAWDVRPNRYWYPLYHTQRQDVIAFQARYADEALGNGVLVQILQEHNITDVFELREGGSVYRWPVDDIDLVYGGDESFWCSSGMDWNIYVSQTPLNN